MSDLVLFFKDPLTRVFLCGVFGSVIVEAMTILQCYQKPGGFPKRYSKKGFWAVRTVVAVAGGVLAMLYDTTNLLLAAHVGASTPLIISTMEKTLPDDSAA
jgi:hypothetical protein